MSDIDRDLVHHCGPKTEKSCDFADRPLLALSDGGTPDVQLSWLGGGIELGCVV